MNTLIIVSHSCFLVNSLCANGAVFDSLTFMIRSDMAHQCTTLVERLVTGATGFQVFRFSVWISLDLLLMLLMLLS